MIKDGWYCCPHCGKRLFRVMENATVKEIQVWCKSCKKGITVNFNIESLEPEIALKLREATKEDLKKAKELFGNRGKVTINLKWITVYKEKVFDDFLLSRLGKDLAFAYFFDDDIHTQWSEVDFATTRIYQGNNLVKDYGIVI